MTGLKLFIDGELVAEQEVIIPTFSSIITTKGRVTAKENFLQKKAEAFVEEHCEKMYNQNYEIYYYWEGGNNL